MSAKSKRNVKQSVVVQERIADVLVEILDRCGVWNKDDDDVLPSWKMMASSLERLVICLEQLGDVENERSLFRPELLLKIEEEIHNVKELSNQVLSDTDDISSTLELCHTLTNLSRENPHIQQISYLRVSLPTAVRTQRDDVFHTVQAVNMNLDSIYDRISSTKSNEVRSLIVSFQNSAMRLHQKCIRVDKGVWRGARKMVKRLLQSGGDSFPLEEIFLTGMDDYVPVDPCASNRYVDSMVSSRRLRSTCFVSAATSFAAGEAGSEHERCILLVGPQGSGKSYSLDQIQKLCSSKVRVIRPSLPFDLMGKKVGSSEDLLLSLFSYAMSGENRSILLLDDIESIIGTGFERSTPSVSGESTMTSGRGSKEAHLVSRNRALLLSLLEFAHRDDIHRRIMLICTSRNNWGKEVDRFDRVFILGNPTSTERRTLLEKYLSECFPKSMPEMTDEITEALSSVVDCTMGLSYADMTFQCRQAMLESKSNNHDDDVSPLDFLSAVKSQLEHTVPESLKTGTLSDFADLRVSTLRDLKGNLSMGTDASNISLFGSSISYAWEELQRLIVTPICQASALHRLLFHDGSSGGKTFAGGVLLTGVPGSGKTALAYHCAAFAAARNPSVKLLDVSCTSLIHKEVGSSEQAIHRLFVTARAAAPCILLLDGIENIAAVRGNDNTTEGTMDRVLSTLLTEVDGVDSETLSIENPACIAIVGITHNPEWVDPALRRPGRLERTIVLGPLEKEARRRIVEQELREVAVDNFGEGSPALDQIFLYIAERTNGLSGASVVGVCNDAKLFASKELLNKEDAATEDAERYSIALRHVDAAIDSQRAVKKPAISFG